MSKKDISSDGEIQCLTQQNLLYVPIYSIQVVVCHLLGTTASVPLALTEVRATHQHTGPKIVMMHVLVLPYSAEIYFTLASKSLTTLQKLQK